MSARNLQRTLGMGSYQTAWMMLYRYRRAMVMPDRKPLEGVVEVDQMTVGGKNKKGKRGRAKDDNRAIVFVMAENPGESLAGGTGLGPGRARLVVLDDYSAPVLAKVMAENIAPDAHIVSDADGSIAAAALLLGHEHTSVATAHAPEPAHMLFPAVSRVQAQAKRWLASTPQGAVSAAHGRLPPRVRVLLQPQDLSQARHAVLPPHGAGRPDGPTHLRGHLQEGHAAPRLPAGRTDGATLAAAVTHTRRRRKAVAEHVALSWAAGISLGSRPVAPLRGHDSHRHSRPRLCGCGLRHLHPARHPRGPRVQRN